MREALHQAYFRLKRSAFERLMQSVFRLKWRFRHVPLSAPALNREVLDAMEMDRGSIAGPGTSAALTALVEGGGEAAFPGNAMDLFLHDGKLLPCVLPGDSEQGCEWFHAASYYPLYYALYRRCLEFCDRPKFLEIGVRTGYQGVVLAKATRGNCTYVGVDPNLYVQNGLALAGRTFALLRQRMLGFDYVLIQGYSWDRDIGDTLAYSAPFDLIHIDGDHTLAGKLIDLELARHLIAPNGLVLVDDYDHHELVRDAVARACAAGWYTQFAYLATLRGLAVLACGQAPIVIHPMSGPHPRREEKSAHASI